jgi:hypothetical protein
MEIRTELQQGSTETDSVKSFMKNKRVEQARTLTKRHNDKGGTMEIRTELKQVLKRLGLSGILFTLMERVSYARGQKLSYEEFLELVLSDEIERRDQGTIQRRIRQGSLDPDQTIERFEWLGVWNAL